MLLFAGVVVTLTPMVVGTLVAYHLLRMNPVIVCGALAGAMTVDAAVTGCCEVAASWSLLLRHDNPGGSVPVRRDCHATGST